LKTAFQAALASFPQSLPYAKNKVRVSAGAFPSPPPSPYTKQKRTSQSREALFICQSEAGRYDFSPLPAAIIGRLCGGPIFRSSRSVRSRTRSTNRPFFCPAASKRPSSVNQKSNTLRSRCKQKVSY